MTKAQEAVMKDVFRVFGDDAIVLHRFNDKYIGAWQNIKMSFPEILRDLLKRCS